MSLLFICQRQCSSGALSDEYLSNVVNVFFCFVLVLIKRVVGSIQYTPPKQRLNVYTYLHTISTPSKGDFVLPSSPP